VFTCESTAFSFAEVAESAGMQAAEPAAKGLAGVISEGAKSAGEFAPEDLYQFLGVGGVMQPWFGPGFEEWVVVGEEPLPCRAIAPGVQSIQQ
jgi:hypothetical protein